MRKTFTNADTTPTPCKAAQDAYLTHCAAMKKDKEDTCEKLAAYKKLNPNCNNSCLAGHMNKLVGLKKKIANNQEIIDNPKIKKQEVKDAAQKRIKDFMNKEKDYLASVNKDVPKKKAEEISVALMDLAAREINRIALLKTQDELLQAIKNIQPYCDRVSAITNPNCKK